MSKRKPGLSRAGEAQQPIQGLAKEISTWVDQKVLNSDNPSTKASLEGLIAFASNDPKQGSKATNIDKDFGERLKDLEVKIRASLGNEGYEQLTAAQIESGIIASFGAGGFKAYAAEAYSYTAATNSTRKTAYDERVPVIAQPLYSAEAMGYKTNIDNDLKVSMAAFDDRQMDNHLPYSIVFNIQAARQDEFGEAFYPTVVATPDQNGIDVLVKRTMVFNEVRHSINGTPIDPMEFRVNAINAYTDFTILAADYTAATPIFVPGNAENNTHFMATAEVAPYDVVLKGGEVVKTAPLSPNVKHNLIGLSQTPVQLAAGNKDITASLDHRISLHKVYLRVTDQVTVGNPVSIIPISTERTPSNLYQRPHDGIDKSLQLSFITTTMALTGATPDVAGSITAAGTAYLRSNPTLSSYVLHLEVTVNGRANVEVGTVAYNPVEVEIAKVYQKQPNGTLTRITDVGIINGLKAQFKIEVAGADILAHLSNMDRRDRGLMVTNVEHFERFAVPYLSPITCPLPMTQTGTGGDVASPINIARLRNSNNAVTKLLSYLDSLEMAGITNTPSDIYIDIEGPGRWMIKPYYHKETIDLTTMVQSLNSANRRADVQAALVNKISERVYDAIQKSAYMPALMSLNGNVPEKPTVTIGTDAYTQQFLMINGDTRTISIGYEHEVVTTQDRRMYGRIICVLTRKGVTGVDVLNFGNFIWMPELATELQMMRYNGTVKEVMIQPRALHLNTCPIAIQFILEGLSDVVTDQLAFPVIGL